MKALTPYWEAQRSKEKANSAYKAGKHTDAVEMYTRALGGFCCHSSTIALNIYNNRAAAYQQLGMQTEALVDSLHVLKYDAANAKALGRADKARARGAKTASDAADAFAAAVEATAFVDGGAAATAEGQYWEGTTANEEMTTPMATCVAHMAISAQDSASAEETCGRRTDEPVIDTRGIIAAAELAH